MKRRKILSSSLPHFVLSLCSPFCFSSLPFSHCHGDQALADLCWCIGMVLSLCWVTAVPSCPLADATGVPSGASPKMIAGVSQASIWLQWQTQTRGGAPGSGPWTLLMSSRVARPLRRNGTWTGLSIGFLLLPATERSLKEDQWCLTRRISAWWGDSAASRTCLGGHPWGSWGMGGW